MKKSLLDICKILRLFVNTFAAYDKYFLLNREYLKHPIYMQYLKKKMFYEFFDKFLKSRLNFEHIQKEGGTHSSCVSQITDFQQRS